MMKWEYWKDEYGSYKKSEAIPLFVISRTQKWHDENPPHAPEAEMPSEQEILNAQLIYESMIKDMKIAELETSHSELMYQLMTTGVL